MRPIIKKAFLLAGLMGLFFFMADRFLFFKSGFFENIASKITYPFMWASSSIASSIQSMKNETLAYEFLQGKYEQLKTDYMGMVDEVIKLRASARMYDSVKELIEFRARYNLADKLIAKVLLRNITTDQHYYLINRGTRDGVTKDMIALHQLHLVGRVSEVFDFYSKVTLITDQFSKVSAFTSQTQAQGIVQGFNCINRCNLSYVNHLMTIQDNDLILSSGQGLIFPEGYCLGKIVVHNLKEKELYHHIQIEPIINLEVLQYVILSDYSKINQG